MLGVQERRLVLQLGRPELGQYAPQRGRQRKWLLRGRLRMWRWQERRGNQPKRRKRRERGSPVERESAVTAVACYGNEGGNADHAAVCRNGDGTLWGFGGLGVACCL